MRNYAGIAVVISLGLAACSSPSTNSGGNAAKSDSPAASAPVETGKPAAPGSAAADGGPSQADADALCAELMKGGTMASCQVKDGQVIIQPK